MLQLVTKCVLVWIGESSQAGKQEQEYNILGPYLSEWLISSLISDRLIIIIGRHDLGRSLYLVTNGLQNTDNEIIKQSCIQNLSPTVMRLFSNSSFGQRIVSRFPYIRA